VIDGERRLRASKIAGLKKIPCIFHEDLSDEPTIRIRQLIANCQREDLLPIEQARAFKALMELTDWSGTQLAAEINVSKATVSRSLALLSLPEDVKTNVEKGDIAASVAYELSHVSGERQQISLAKEIIREELNRQQAIQRAKVAAASTKGTAGTRNLAQKTIRSSRRATPPWSSGTTIRKLPPPTCRRSCSTSSSSSARRRLIRR
jgi:ParB family chromosome partitioning protein